MIRKRFGEDPCHLFYRSTVLELERYASENPWSKKHPAVLFHTKKRSIWCMESSRWPHCVRISAVCKTSALGSSGWAGGGLE